MKGDRFQVREYGSFGYASGVWDKLAQCWIIGPVSPASARESAANLNAANQGGGFQ